MFAYSTFTFGFLLMIAKSENYASAVSGEKAMTLILEIMKIQKISILWSALVTLELQ